MTSAPWRANSSAIARPIPPDAPVMAATWPAKGEAFIRWVAEAIALDESAECNLQSSLMRFCCQRGRLSRGLPLLSFLAASALGLSTAAQEPVAVLPPADRVAQLIADLGSNAFSDREHASEELARIGLPAFSALEAALKHPDREVRLRSDRVLKLIKTHDTQRRLDAFLHGQEGSDDFQLPAWGRFRKGYGDDP